MRGGAPARVSGRGAGGDKNPRAPRPGTRAGAPFLLPCPAPLCKTPPSDPAPVSKL